MDRMAPAMRGACLSHRFWTRRSGPMTSAYDKLYLELARALWTMADEIVR